MRVVKAAAVQLSPVLYSCEGTVERVVRKIHELGQQGVEFATFPETLIPYYPYFSFVQSPLQNIAGPEQGGQGPKMLRLVVGNPVIMKEMAKTVPDAASYAPVTILVDERAGGVHLSYDSMASLLAPYGSETALVVARDLDAKIENLLQMAQGTARA